MQSTRFADDRPEFADLSLVEPETEEVESPGFLAVVVVLFLIYAMTSRPVLYASIDEWVSQILRILLFGVKTFVSGLIFWSG